ncbi:ATP-binding protein [Roseateles sp. BYS87W]|uniref:histidine kinase n=1 Tax=Pelomonas baiyunensis TaxID=3299026 RepID=A0ABW7GUY0_9BURK
MPRAARTPRPNASVLGRAGLLARVLAGLLALAVLLGLAGIAEYERREALEHAQDRAELLARTLEDHVTRTVDSAALILKALGEGIARQANAEPDRLQPLLGQSLVANLPFLRSVAVLDEHGRVLASSIAAEQGLRLAVARFGAWPRDGQERLLAWMPGRGLADLTAAEAPPRATDVGMVPLLRALRTANGQRVLLVALINPGALANFSQGALSEPGSVALLAGLDGTLVAANDQSTPAPGARLNTHPVFAEWLPAREHGAYRGTGAQAGPQVVAFRASRTRPLVMLVELDEKVLLQSWSDRLVWLAGLGGLALMLIAGGLGVLLREMRAREQARTALDSAHEEVALREREMAVLLKSVQELIFRTDAAGVITFINARWAAVGSESRAQVVGRRLADLVVADDRVRTAALFRLDDRAGARQAQVSITAPDGRPWHFLVAVVPLHSDGRIVGFAGSAVDVSERVASDAQLQRQLDFTGLLLELSPLPVSMFDTAGRYVLVNQAWEELVGQPREMVIGTSVGASLAQVDAQLHAEQDALLLAEGGRLSYATQVQHRDGTRRDMVITKVLVPGGQGGPEGILCTLMDVSEFRTAERATLEARDAAEEASRAKSEFIANISHELRTPLQAILGFSELGYTRGRESPKLAAMFTDIHQSGQRMLALVNDLLDVAKIESSVGTFELERCDLRNLVQAVLRELDPLMAKKRLRLVLRVADEPLSAKVDPGRIQQAIRNVMANAIKFSPEGAPLEVRAVAATPEEFLLTVEDRGPGIPPEELESIFEAFVQSSKTKDGSGGTGLGLAISRKIVEVHGGSIKAANRPDGGAMFSLRLPLRAPGDSQLHTTY